MLASRGNDEKRDSIASWVSTSHIANLNQSLAPVGALAATTSTIGSSGHGSSGDGRSGLGSYGAPASLSSSERKDDHWNQDSDHYY